MKKLSITLVLIICVVFQNPFLSCADEDTEKFVVFTEFFQVIGAETQYMQMQSILMDQISKGFVYAINDQVEKSEKISEEEKRELGALINNYMKSALINLQEKFQKEIPFSELIENVYFPTYEKYFSIAELKDIIAYYQSPIGKKFVKLTPSLMQEATSTMNSLYEKKIIEISQRVVAEEMTKIKPAIERMAKN